MYEGFVNLISIILEDQGQHTPFPPRPHAMCFKMFGHFCLPFNMQFLYAKPQTTLLMQANCSYSSMTSAINWLAT